MEQSEKVLARAPRVLHGPHRLHMSGVVTQPALPTSDVPPTLVAGDYQIASEQVEILVEFVTIEEPK